MESSTFNPELLGDVDFSGDDFFVTDFTDSSTDAITEGSRAALFHATTPTAPAESPVLLESTIIYFIIAAFLIVFFLANAVSAAVFYASTKKELSQKVDNFPPKMMGKVPNYRMTSTSKGSKNSKGSEAPSDSKPKEESQSAAVARKTKSVPPRSSQQESTDLRSLQ